MNNGANNLHYSFFFFHCTLYLVHSIGTPIIQGQRIFPVGMMGKALTHIKHIE